MKLKCNFYKRERKLLDTLNLQPEENNGGLWKKRTKVSATSDKFGKSYHSEEAQNQIYTRVNQYSRNRRLRRNALTNYRALTKNEAEEKNEADRTVIHSVRGFDPPVIRRLARIASIEGTKSPRRRYARLHVHARIRAWRIHPWVCNLLSRRARSASGTRSRRARDKSRAAISNGSRPISSIKVKYMAALITKRFRDANWPKYYTRAREEKGREGKRREEKRRRRIRRSRVEDGQERETMVSPPPEGATSQMHYSWTVRRYDMIQYVLATRTFAPICRTSDEIPANNTSFPNLLKIGPRIFE